MREKTNRKESSHNHSNKGGRERERVGRDEHRYAKEKCRRIHHLSRDCFVPSNGKTADDGADTDGDVECSIGTRISVQCKLSKQGDYDGEFIGKCTDDSHHDERVAHHRRTPNVAEAFHDLAANGGEVLCRLELVFTHQKKRNDDRNKRNCVYDEAHAESERGNENARDSRTDDSRKIDLHRVERDSIVEVVCAHHLGNKYLTSGAIDCVHESERKRENLDHPDLCAIGQYENAQNECQKA